jgi:H+/Cl- antiporter ClcA
MIPDFRWEFVSEEQLGEVIATAWRNRKGTVRRLVYPVVHEPLVFFLGCMVGMTVACVSVWVFVGTVFADRYREEIRSWEIALLMAAGLGVYVIITLLATWLLIASRRVVWMVFRSSSFWRRSLPGPSTAHHPRQ